MEPPCLHVISLSWFSTSAYIWDEHSRFCLTRWTVKLFTIIKLTTSELVFNAYRSLCDFTIILDYYYHLIHERNIIYGDIILWQKWKYPKSGWIPKELCYVSILLKIVWKYCHLLNFPLLIHLNSINLKIIYYSKVIHLW